MLVNGMRPIHPGEVLREEFMHPYDISEAQLSEVLHVPAGVIRDVVKEKKPVNADLALRLGRYFNTTPTFWMNLQNDFSLKTAEKEHGTEIVKQVVPLQEPA